jgi:hypothetical protein
MLPWAITDDDIANATCEHERQWNIDQQAFEQEAIELYEWWQKRLYGRPDLKAEVPELSDEKFEMWLENLGTDDPEIEEFRRSHKRYTDATRALMQRDFEMFHRLVDIHRNIWY